MPLANGKFLLVDFDQELLDQGFDAIPQPRRYRWINFAYRRIASKYPWLWEKTSADAVMLAGEFSLDFTVDFPNFKSLEYLYVVTTNQERRLRPVDDDQFYNSWLALDLAAAKNRGEPTKYKIEDNQIYILPPPQSTRIIRAKYHRQVTNLDNTVPNTSDNPITPQYLDEAIVIASLSVAHKRTHELQLAAQAEVDLGEWINQMNIDEEWQDVNDLQRIGRDDTWL